MEQTLTPCCVRKGKWGYAKETYYNKAAPPSLPPHPYPPILIPLSLSPYPHAPIPIPVPLSPYPFQPFCYK